MSVLDDIAGFFGSLFGGGNNDSSKQDNKDAGKQEGPSQKKEEPKVDVASTVKQVAKQVNTQKPKAIKQASNKQATRQQNDIASAIKGMVNSYNQGEQDKQDKADFKTNKEDPRFKMESALSGGALKKALREGSQQAEEQAKQQADAAFDYSDALTKFMNSDNPYAQAYLKDNGISDGSFNWYNDYGNFAANGGKDVWSSMITSSDEMKRAYMDDYGKGIDFDNNGDISTDEAGKWWDNMKKENQVSDLNFTRTDDEIMQRIFGGLGGEGMDNDLVDAINMIQTNSLVSALASGASMDDLLGPGSVINTPYASDTGDTFANTVGLVEALGKEGLTEEDLNSQEVNDKIARLNNALKLDYLMSAADANRDSGEPRTIIDFGAGPGEYANQMASLLNNVAGGEAGLRMAPGDRAITPENMIYDTPTSGNKNADAIQLANAIINSGGSGASNDDVAYLLLNNLGAGNGKSLADQGYKAFRSEGKYAEGGRKDPNQSTNKGQQKIADSYKQPMSQATRNFGGRQDLRNAGLTDEQIYALQ